MRRFRVLVVEDDLTALELLEKLIKRAVPGVIIVSARTVTDAHKLIAEALNTQKPFDLAILDFKLPRDRPEENPEIDVSICQLLTRRMPESVIGHVTSHMEDRDVVAHNREAHPPGQKKGFVVGKISGGDSPSTDEDLPRLVRQSLYDPWIENEIGRLVAATSPQTVRMARSGDWDRPAGITTRLMRLKLEIAQYFGCLSPRNQEWVREYFDVSPRVGVALGDPVRYEVRSRVEVAR